MKRKRASNYRLVIDLGPDSPAKTLVVNLTSREEALVVAQRYNRPAELWDDGKRLCTITHSGEMLVISGPGDHIGNDPGKL